MLKYLFLILSLILTGLITYLTPLTIISNWYLLILIFILSYILFNILYFIIIYFISLTIDIKKEYTKTTKFHKWILDQTLQLLCELSRVKIKVVNKEIMPKNQKYLFVFNHKSNFDPMIQSYIFKKDNLIHISKEENFKIPIAGPFIKRNCYLVIDRENARNAITTINKAANFIKTGYASVGVSPEGTRNKGEGMLPFKPGSFKIAYKSECPIVIASMRNTEMIHKNFPFHRTKVEMRILKVLNYDEYMMMNTTEIAEKIEKIIADDLNIEIKKGEE